MPAHTTRRFFSRETEVTIDINARAADVWAILTDGAAYPQWTATVLSFSGHVATGESIALVSSLDPKRTFKLKVKRVEPPTSFSWGDAMGERTYRLTSLPGGGVRFHMHERIGGPLFPLFARMIPSFDGAFNQFAADLKRHAESRSSGAPS